MNYYDEINKLTTHTDHYESREYERCFQNGFKHARHKAAEIVSKKEVDGMRYFLINKEIETGGFVNDDGDDRYTYEDIPSVLTCNSLTEAEAICSEINASIIREIKIWVSTKA